MPVPMDALLGLVVVALGLLILAVSFLVTDSRKQKIAYGIAGLVVAMGLYYYISSGMRGFQMRRRISDIQRQQQVNLDEIQKRLRNTQIPSLPQEEQTPQQSKTSGQR